jgi:hypothetical protein
VPTPTTRPGTRAAALQLPLSVCRCRGNVDTDVLLGNVASFLHKKGLLEKYDIITPCCNDRDNSSPSFGPFMLYRNVPHVTELFRQMESLYDSLSNQTVMMIDEWGGFPTEGSAFGPYFNRSMSRLIHDKKDALNIRVVSKFKMAPFGSDLPCLRPDQLHNGNLSWSVRFKDSKGKVALPCGLCRWTLGDTKTGSRLMAQSNPFTLMQVAFCHYQYGKGVTVRNLHTMSKDEMAVMLASPTLEHTFSDGFQPISSDGKIHNKKRKQIKFKFY